MTKAIARRRSIALRSSRYRNLRSRLVFGADFARELLLVSRPRPTTPAFFHQILKFADPSLGLERSARYSATERQST